MNPIDYTVIFISGLLITGVLINLINYEQGLNSRSSLGQELINIILIVNNLKSVDYDFQINYSLSPGRLLISNESITIVRDGSYSASNPGVKAVDCYFNNSLIISRELINCA